MKLQYSILGEQGNRGRQAPSPDKWRETCAQVLIQPPLPPFRPPRLVEFPYNPPLRPVLASSLLHLAAVLVIVGLLPLLPLAFPFNNAITIQQPDIRSDHIIYLPPGYLPQLQDSGGAESAKAGTSGGRTGHHPNQRIRVARTSVVTKGIAEAHLLVLPPTVPAANLVSFAGRAHTPALPLAQPALPLPPISVARPISQIALSNPDPAVVPPPPDLSKRDLPKSNLVLPRVKVVAPVLSLDKRKLSDLTQLPALETKNVVAPVPPNVSADIGNRKLETSVPQVAPPPIPTSVQASPSAANPTAMASPVSNGGSSNTHDLVLSGSPGERVGVPTSAGSGSLAVSSTGMGSSGLGGTGGGAGVGEGSGSGNAKEGRGIGAGGDGSGVGASSTAKGGLSPTAGPGGSGTGVHPSSLPGVSIQGGNVYVPSFGSGSGVSARSHVETGPGRSPTITIVATARSGGALNIYGLFKGSKVYTVYLDTPAGPVVLQYAERKSGMSTGFETDLTAPVPIDLTLPVKLPHAPVIIACILSRSGWLQNIRVMKAGAADAAHQIEVALKGWRFYPARNGQRAIDVDAVLGFDIDTR